LKSPEAARAEARVEPLPAPLRQMRTQPMEDIMAMKKRKKLAKAGKKTA
jgi:hypothetical protein